MSKEKCQPEDDLRKPDLCIYHGNCADGFGAAWAVWKMWGDSVEYHPGVYGQMPPDVTGKRVLIVDFSYPYDTIVTMSFQARRMVILDHHKTARDALERLPPLSLDRPAEDLSAACQMCWTQNMPEICAAFDMERSGAMLAWNYCHPGKPAPRLIRFIQDRDLWRFDLPASREFAAYLFSHEYDVGTWDTIAEAAENDTQLLNMTDQGGAIERKHHKDIRELLAESRRPMTIGGHSVQVANLPYTMSSDAAGLLAEGGPFGACYFDTPTGRRFSLRSRGPDGVDVSEVAKMYGGGGHRNAAGFEMPLGWNGDAPAT